MSASEATPLKGQTALVTGASSGIGRATAARLAASGAHVVLAARRAERLQEVADEIVAAGGQASVRIADVAIEKELSDLASWTLEQRSQVDILVNNAGHAYGAAVHAIDADKLDQIFAVNFRAAVLLTRDLLPSMVRRRSGLVVNVGSVSCRAGYPGGTPYVASKFALRGFAECLWQEVRGYGVRTLLLMPDFVASPEFFERADLDFPYVDQALDPASVAECIDFAARLPPEVIVRELELCPPPFSPPKK